VRRLVRTLLSYPAIFLWPAALYVTWLGLGDIVHAGYCFAALALVLLGCFPRFSAGPPLPAVKRETFLPSRLLGWLTVAVLVLATFVRIWKVWEWPPDGLHFEEDEIGSGALGLDLPGEFLFTVLQWYGQLGEHKLPYVSTAFSFHFLGPDYMTMRLPFIVAGVLSPFFLYAACRRLASWEASLFALLLFSVSWLHIAGSRVADEIFFPVVVEAALLWSLVHFMDTGRMWSAYLVALLSGLLVYEYTSYHAVVFLVIGYLGAALVRCLIRLEDAESGKAVSGALAAGARRYAPGVLVMVLVWTIVAFVMLVGDFMSGGGWFAGGVAGHAGDATGLLSQKVGDLPGFVLARITRPLEIAYRPGGFRTDAFGQSDHPMFDPVTACAMGLGLVLVALTFWRRFHLLMLAWIGLVWLGGALLPGTINPFRFYMALPVLYLTIALGTEVLWRWAGRRARWVLLILMATGGAYAAVDNLHHFFGWVVPEAREAWEWPRTSIANWIRQRERDATIWVLGTEAGWGDSTKLLGTNCKFLVDGWNVHETSADDHGLPEVRHSGAPLYFILAYRPPNPEMEAKLRHRYPNARALPPLEVRRFKLSLPTFQIP
jgi:hypothetical protein